jgi:hypothetical protein
MCRKAHGSAFATYVAAATGDFRWTRGQERIRRYESSTELQRFFCSRCGSVVPGADDGGEIFMAAGCLDDDPGLRPEAHIFVASKAPWHEIHDDLPRFDAYPDVFGAKEVEGPRVAAAREGSVGGSCLCGAVAYELDGALELIVDCHCSRCRKSRGAAFASNLLVRASQLRWLRGESGVLRYRVPDALRLTSCFCGVCGSLLPRVDDEQGIAIVPAGALDQDPGARERLHIYTGSKAPWYEIADALPRFESAPPSAEA